MKVILTAVIAAIEACAVAIASLAIVAVPAVLLWWLGFDLGSEPRDVAAVVAAIWQLVHLVPLVFELSPEVALSFGLPGESLGVDVSLPPLGLTLLTIALAFRSGIRFSARGGTGAAGVLGGALGFAAAAAAVAALGAPYTAWPLWQVIAVPTLCYAVSALAGYLLRAGATGHPWWQRWVRVLQRQLEPFASTAAAALPARAATALRLAAALSLALVVVATAGFALAIVSGYIEIVTLSQGLHLDFLGEVLLFLLQLSYLPVAWIWTLAWFTGTGFSVGSGSSVSPFDALLGPLPSLPLFGAIPQGWGAAAIAAPALVVLAGIVVGAVFGRTIAMRRMGWPSALFVTVVAAALVGLASVGLGALATGAIGPGRLVETGPDPWVFGGLLAAEAGGGLLLGVLATRVDLVRVAEATQARLPTSGRTAVGDPAAETVPLEPLVGTRQDAPAPRSDLQGILRGKLQGSSRADLLGVPGVDPAKLPPVASPVASQASQGSQAAASVTSAVTSAVAPPVAPLAPSDHPSASRDGETHATEELDSDALLRAYAWGSDDAAGDSGSVSPSADAPSDPERPRRWRPSWRKR